jgi:uncharacterized protein
MALATEQGKENPKASNSEKGVPLVYLFFAWCYAVALAQFGAFVWRESSGSLPSWGYGIALVLTYALIYTLPVLVCIWLSKKLDAKAAWVRFLSGALVVFVASSLQLLAAADYMIYEMFGYHINGFVINLISTPEGVESMGADPGMFKVLIGVVLGIFAINALIWWWGQYQVARWFSFPVGRKWFKRAVLALVLLSLSERITYAVSAQMGWTGVTTAAAAIPGYQRLSVRSLAKKMGFEVINHGDLRLSGDDEFLDYPKQPLTHVIPEKTLNVAWFVCESLRADMLTPEIMPKTWAFAAESQRFTQHHSGGNGTRMGVFTAFYGMPGSYWFRYLRYRRSPVLMDHFQELNYRLHCSTSAAFSYPEFDKTIFSRVSLEFLTAADKGSGWESDRYHVARMKKWLAEDDGKAPFFLFHFFESPHARYYFPPESVIRSPYLEDFNYSTVDLKRDIGLIKNRYINAVHHLDSQIGEMIEALRAKDLLDSTIIVITGDHGEEFMENGRWGHNSEFSEPQVRVPLVFHVPGRTPGVFDYPTSHVDFVPTILPMLGVTTPASNYSTGQDLFSNSPPRLLTFSDWDRVGISDGVNKVIFPLGVSGQLTTKVTTYQDVPVEDQGAVLKTMGAPMVHLREMMSRFTRKK